MAVFEYVFFFQSSPWTFKNPLDVVLSLKFLISLVDVSIIRQVMYDLSRWHPRGLYVAFTWSLFLSFFWGKKKEKQRFVWLEKMIWQSTSLLWPNKHWHGNSCKKLHMTGRYIWWKDNIKQILKVQNLDLDPKKKLRDHPCHYQYLHDVHNRLSTCVIRTKLIFLKEGLFPHSM